MNIKAKNKENHVIKSVMRQEISEKEWGFKISKECDFFSKNFFYENWLKHKFFVLDFEESQIYWAACSWFWFYIDLKI